MIKNEMRNWKAYRSIIRMRFILLLQYRMAALAGICTQFFFGFVRTMALEAFYSSTQAVQPMTLQQAVNYIWLSQALLGILPWGGDAETGMMIRSGNVAYELCRPLHPYNHWFCRALAMRTAPTLLRAVPILAVSLVLPAPYGLQLPPSASAALSWLLATLCAVLISCAITNLLVIAMLWTISGEGIIRLLPAVVIFLSGMVVPLPLFPGWLRPIVELLPFSGLVDIPMRFYTGHLAPIHLPAMLLQQLVWAVILILSGRWLLDRGLKRIVIQGG